MFPLVVPFTTTDAPVTGPKESTTVPVPFPSCCEKSMPGLTGAISA